MTAHFARGALVLVHALLSMLDAFVVLAMWAGGLWRQLRPVPAPTARLAKLPTHLCLAIVEDAVSVPDIARVRFTR